MICVGECYFCKNAMQHFCTDNIGVGTTVDGGFAEYVIMHEKQLYTFSDDLSFIEAAMAEPVSCCLHGTTRHIFSRYYMPKTD